MSEARSLSDISSITGGRKQNFRQFLFLESNSQKQMIFESLTVENVNNRKIQKLTDEDEEAKW